jgi:hypothetical protein
MGFVGYRRDLLGGTILAFAWRHREQIANNLDSVFESGTPEQSECPVCYRCFNLLGDISILYDWTEMHLSKVKVKQSLYTSWRRLGGEEYSSYSFSTSALDGGEWSASRSGRSLPPGKGSPVPIVQEAGCAPEPFWTQMLEEKSFAPTGDRTPIARSYESIMNNVLVYYRWLLCLWPANVDHNAVPLQDAPLYERKAQSYVEDRKWVLHYV